MKYRWSSQMPDEKKKEETPKRVNRFIYSDEDVNHIFRLGKTGGIFKEETKQQRVSSLLKKIQEIKKKMTK